ncbi:hypothetical protein CCP3SC15_330025 [Gammaproteobacteria bacterium]
MNATLYSGILSLSLSIDPPVEDDGVTPRRDICATKIWMSAINGFVADETNLVFSGVGFIHTLSGLTAGTRYYVKYALISEIDPLDYVISDCYSEIPNNVAEGLGLGEAAFLNVGTSPGTVAAGDHNHNCGYF